MAFEVKNKKRVWTVIVVASYDIFRDIVESWKKEKVEEKKKVYKDEKETTFVALDSDVVLLHFDSEENLTHQDTT